MSKKVRLSHTHFVKSLAQVKVSSETLIIYDRNLIKAVPSFESWIKKQKLSVPVNAGEALKDFKNFFPHVNKIIKKIGSDQVTSITAIGGGSVGDFAGFFASIFKRGIDLTLIPTTWLSAIDSSYGGKNGLNLNLVKNQLGSFYPAQDVFLVKSILMTQPEVRAHEGFGELFKIALIAGGAFWQNFSRETEVNSALLWKYLPQAIDAKLRIVRKDPFEKKGLRRILNLGHTVGHCWEVLYQWPHGLAVNLGITFALRWSIYRNSKKRAPIEKILKSSVGSFLMDPYSMGLLHQTMTDKNKFEKILQKDKKREGNEIDFIFINSPGKIYRERVSVKDVIQEVQRQHRQGRFNELF